MTPLRILVAATVAFSLAAPGFAQDATKDTVVATVNGEAITLGHLIVARSQLPEQYQNIPAQTLFSGLISQLTQQTLLAQSAGDDTDRVRLSLENERRTLLSAEVVNSVINENLTDADVRALYDERYGAGGGEPEFNASHILVDSEEEALAVRSMIVDDGADFAETAKAKSTGPSGPNGGELGWFGPGMMVPPFEAAVRDLEPGQVSNPVQTQFGWHIVKLNDSRTTEPPAFEAVAGELINELQNSVVEAHITDLQAEAEIVVPELNIDPSILTNVDLLTQ